MKPKKFSTARFGSVSAGTMRPEDLIPSFCSELRYLGHRSKTLTEIERKSETKKYYQSEGCNYDLESLFNMLEEHAPQYAYFGSHSGDGSDYGFWLSEFIIDDFDSLKVEDLSEVPNNYIGEVLQQNDHGNLTLWYKSARKFKEIWAVV